LDEFRSAKVRSAKFYSEETTQLAEGSLPNESPNILATSRLMGPPDARGFIFSPSSDFSSACESHARCDAEYFARLSTIPNPVSPETFPCLAFYCHPRHRAFYRGCPTLRSPFRSTVIADLHNFEALR
jgi:hypothetical protein